MFKLVTVRTLYFNAVKQCCTSKKYLFATIFYTVSLILSFALLPNAVLQKLVGSYDDLLYNLGIEPADFPLSYGDISSFAGAFKTLITVITVIGVILSVCFCASMWINYAVFKKKSKNYITLGFKVVKVASIVSLVIASALLAVLLGVLIFLMINPEDTILISSGVYSFEIGGLSRLAIGIVMGAAVLFGTLTVLYFALLIKSMINVCRMCDVGVKARISGYIGFINFLTALFLLVPMVGCVYVAVNMDGSFMLMFFSCGFAALSAIMFMSFISEFNRYMRAARKYAAANKDDYKRGYVRVSEELLNSAPSDSVNKEKFTVVIDEESENVRLQVEKCKNCGKYYDGFEYESCPYCFYDDSDLNINFKELR